MGFSLLLLIFFRDGLFLILISIFQIILKILSSLNLSHCKFSNKYYNTPQQQNFKFPLKLSNVNRQTQKMVKIIDNYTLTDLIGNGNYAHVYKATHKYKQGFYAVKVIPIEKFQQIQKLQECMNNEIKVLTMIGSSPHIITYYEKIKSKTNYYFVYDFCNGGTLESYIRKKQKLSEAQSLSIFSQLQEAFKILNKHKIMHRDLKPENILFHNGKVKLADFGFCKGLQSDDSLTKTMLGSPIYMAPQVLKGHMYTSKADLWSLGVILYEMIYGVCPYNSKNIFDLINNIETHQISFPLEPTISDRTKSLIKKMLIRDAFRRINWAQLLQQQITQTGQYAQNKKDNLSVHSKSFSETKSPLISKQSLDQSLSNFNLQLSLNQQKKPASLTKPERKKVFYSQNFIDLLSSKNIPLIGLKDQTRGDRKNTTNFLQRMQLKKQENSLRPIQNQAFIKSSNNQQKRRQFINTHEKITNQLLNFLKELTQKGQKQLPETYLGLKRVQATFKQLQESWKKADFDPDMNSLINYQSLQLDRFIVQVKQQMEKQSLESPSYDENHKNSVQTRSQQQQTYA